MALSSPAAGDGNGDARRAVVTQSESDKNNTVSAKLRRVCCEADPNYALFPHACSMTGKTRGLAFRMNHMPFAQPAEVFSASMSGCISDAVRRHRNLQFEHEPVRSEIDKTRRPAPDFF
jgi:hypothetical protein